MATKQINVERFSITSAKPFTEVVSAIAAKVGHPNMRRFVADIQAATDDQEFRRVVNEAAPSNEAGNEMM